MMMADIRFQNCLPTTFLFGFFLFHPFVRDTISLFSYGNSDPDPAFFHKFIKDRI